MIIKYYNVPTPMCIVCPVIDCDMLYAEDAGQVHPPGGVVFINIRYNALSSPDTQI